MIEVPHVLSSSAARRLLQCPQAQVEIFLKSHTETQVTAMSVQQDWVMGEAALTHRYATPTNKGTPWYAQLVGYAPTSVAFYV